MSICGETLSLVLQSPHVLFQVAEKEDKVTAAGQTVQDVESQQSQKGY